MASSGQKRTTLKDVADAVGVHVSTVSRALDPRTRHMIRSNVAEEILKVSRDLSYAPNAAAYTLRTNRTKLVGVVIPDITNPVFPPIIRGIEDMLRSSGYVAIVVNTDGSPDREAALTATLLARGIDGIIFASISREAEAIDSLLGDVAAVTVNRRVDGRHFSSVVSDENSGMRAVLEHLASLGHHKVAAIAGPQALSTGKIRLQAFRQIASELGLAGDPDAIAIADAFNEAEGERCMEILLGRPARFTAVVACNDRLAIGAIAALRRSGIACPGEMSVTGFNDMYLADRIDPPLTTVRIRPYSVGQAAAELLLSRMDAGDDVGAPVHRVLPIELVVRASSAPARPGQ